MKSELLQRLSKEKPENNSDEIEEALRCGYSMRQIMRAMNSGMRKTEICKGFLKFFSSKGELGVPYTYETFLMLCKYLFK